MKLNKNDIFLIISFVIVLSLMMYVIIKTNLFVELLKTCEDEFEFIKICKCIPKGVDWRI